MYENSGSHFFRTTTGIQSGPDAFDESRFVMTFLTILGVMEILCSFRLVLEGKTGKEIPESSRFEFLEKFLATDIHSVKDGLYLYNKDDKIKVYISKIVHIYPAPVNYSL